MRLNNKGWGLSTFMLCIGIFCVALIISAFYIYRLGAQLNKDLSTTEPKVEKVPYKYQNDMQNISAATSKYIEQKNIVVANNEKIIIDIKDLLEANLMNSVKDYEYQNECNGYALITKKDNSLKIKPYLNCESYTTEGYGEF